jgi:hypothetical protein
MSLAPPKEFFPTGAQRPTHFTKRQEGWSFKTALHSLVIFEANAYSFGGFLLGQTLLLANLGQISSSNLERSSGRSHLARISARHEDENHPLNGNFLTSSRTRALYKRTDDP